ncbi:hypothetical protein C5C18_14725 [Rathayibacter tritici]|uniref:hypothetical protein n=1 Tax=Rathayibacter tritici TaxID=33888 RepID=UPI00083487A2|nr:hypothetical protein [Rathayibacter tritici]PPF29915.1 hypothetical protein C5C06_06160 [Rathayibacter tritici]PPF62156.1 hypothetical protein C5C21_14395 [Rathayibacter tritici]PPG02211.1 hypothetical protein C5C18_14725 [Rathayibacter tritici]PPI19925.1 hypothetical protein C5D07_00885 [Rathayibacter tritici]PPI50101.1 hypothetical protein C5D18_01045 [Rathayibacter tritici]
MTEHALPYRITERFPLPDGRVGVSTWWARDPEQLEHQLRTRTGHPHPEREPARRLHRSGANGVLVEERTDGGYRPLDPHRLARTDPRWRRALVRSRRSAWLRRIIGPRDLVQADPPSDVTRTVEQRGCG